MENCLMCGGHVQPLGKLGHVTHYRCRNCGMDQMSTATETELEDELDDEENGLDEAEAEANYYKKYHQR